MPNIRKSQIVYINRKEQMMRYITMMIILGSIFLMMNCSSQNELKYHEISYHQESFILYDFLTYYKEDFGMYPDDLEELSKLFESDSTEYSGVNKSNLKKNITDPFSGENYKYLLIDTTTFILYSVGADGTDNNSDILSKYKTSGMIKFNYYDKKSSVGDILIYHLENGEIINDLTDVSCLK